MILLSHGHGTSNWVEDIKWKCCVSHMGHPLGSNLQCNSFLLFGLSLHSSSAGSFGYFSDRKVNKYSYIGNGLIQEKSSDKKSWIRHSDQNSLFLLQIKHIYANLLIYWWYPSKHARIARRQQNRAAQDWAIGRKILDRASKKCWW